VIKKSFLTLKIGLSEKDPFEQLVVLEGEDHATKLYNAFTQNMRVVELSNMNKESEIVVFPKVKECQEISKEIRDEIMEDFDPRNPTGLFYSILLEFKNIQVILKKKVNFRKRFGLFYVLVQWKSIYM